MGASLKIFLQVYADFINKYSSIYYESDTHWITTASFKDGCFQPSEELSRIMKAVVENASRDQQVSLLNAYPDLSYKVRDLKALSKNSRNEQLGVGLDQCSPEEGLELDDLNTRYKEKFGFPFIIAVRGVRNRYDILNAMRQRIKNDQEMELRTALEQIHKIAGFRLSDLDT